MSSFDDTKRFISKQNVGLIQRIGGCSFQEARNSVISLLQQNNGYISSLSDANEQVLNRMKGVRVASRPMTDARLRNRSSESVEDRMQRMQKERDSLFKRPEQIMTESVQPPVSTQDNTLVSVENRDDIAKDTARRLEEMQRSRAVVIPIPRAQEEVVDVDIPTTHLITQNQSINVVFHSQHSERKPGQEWWDKIWTVPELHTMAMAATLQVPYFCVETTRRTGMRRLLVKILDVQDMNKNKSWILTPSQTKVESVCEFMIDSEIQDVDRNVWSYHFKPVDSNEWIWNRKTERVHLQLIPVGIGHFWNDDEISSWSIVIKWSRQ